MKEQSKRGKALSLALTASLVATLNVPAVAFADEAENSATQDVEQQLDATAATAVEDAVAVRLRRLKPRPRACLQPRCFRTRRTLVVRRICRRWWPAIGLTVEYTSLSEALDAATDGQTVKVLADTTMEKTGRVDGKSITLDLNGCTVQVDNRAFNVVNGGRLTLDDAKGTGALKVNKIGSTLSLGVVTGSKGSVVMKGGTLEVPDYGIYTTNDDTGAYVSSRAV